MTGYNNLDELLGDTLGIGCFCFVGNFLRETKLPQTFMKSNDLGCFLRGAPNPLNFFTTFIIALFLMILVVFFVDIQADLLKNIPCSHLQET